MERTLIRNLASSANGRVKVCGFIENIRDQKHVQFIVVRDHTSKVQVVNDKTNPPNEFQEAISSLTRESTVEIVGTVELNERVKLGGLEIKLENLNVVSISEPMLPILPGATLDQRMDYRWLDLRRPEVSLVFEVQTTMEMAMREWWIKNGFRELHSPKLTASSTESGSELFSMPYFETTACLAQSPQFYKQMAMAAGFDRVFEIGPVFRANPSFTSRHDTEFTSVDMEVSWIDSHEDVMSIEERWLTHVIGTIKSVHGDEIEKVLGRTLVIPTLPFPRVTIAEAYEMVLQDGYEIPREEKGDLNPEAERRLSRLIMEKYGHELVFVKDYPITARPFYHMRYPDAPTTTKSFDLLWNGLEITTGAQREHRYERLVNQTIEKGLELEGLQHYLNFFRYGVPPHGGMGIGLTRLLMIITGLGNVREVTFLYRGPNRLTP